MKKTALSLKKLTAMRKHIDACDRAIVRVLAERFAVVRKISQVKKDLALPVLQKKRKGEIRKTRIEQGRRLGLRAPFVEKIFNSIQAESIAIQKKDRSK
ncbi:MAG: chorismate mutase [Bdellovibrionota bacterium]